jgi:hypothetical protein
VGTVCPATAPPPFWVALPVPPLLALPPLLQPAAMTDTTANPSAIFIGRFRPLDLCLFMCPPLKGS